MLAKVRQKNVKIESGISEDSCFGQRDVEHADFERSRAQKPGVFAWAKSKGIFRQDSQDLQDYQD